MNNRALVSSKATNVIMGIIQEIFFVMPVFLER